MAVLPDPIPPSAPTIGPCHPWTTKDIIRNRCGLTVAEVDDDALDFGIELASLILWSNTGRRLGLCQRTVRPCFAGTHMHNGHGPYPIDQPTAAYAADLVDSIYGTTYRLPAACGCALPMLELPGPIGGVIEIRYNGTVIDLATVKVKTGGINSRRALLRTDGETWWCCNDLEGDPAVATTDGCPAWDVTYWQGIAIDTRAQGIASILAEQIARQHCNDSKCDSNMVTGLTRVSRRGVTREYDNTDLDEGRTGLDLVDKWVAAVNPHGAKRRPQIARADDTEARRLWSWVDAA